MSDEDDWGDGAAMDDLALMVRVAASDQGALGALYDRYGRQVYALALRMLQDGAAAEDVTQDVFLKVWRSAARFDADRGRVGTWILHIAYTTTVDLIRARRRAMPSRFDDMPEETDTGADPAGDAETAVLGAQVKSALMRLPAEQRQALELAYFGAMTQQEIAGKLGIPLGTVKGRVRLGLEALRQFLMMPRRKEADPHARMSPR
ncbi:MAG: polymerase subunit sigma-24 [Symbiobacteriaceae bacterium]|jgi:RNA polymerase sigma-70 factor (ECF subfamily)|nr:polymerase subunit sigma-24 [Symbiobacteriaceae bacterium]